MKFEDIEERLMEWRLKEGNSLTIVEALKELGINRGTYLNLKKGGDVKHLKVIQKIIKALYN